MPPASSTFSSERYDLLRASHPELVINLYSMTPGGNVTLEVITPDGQSFNWSAPTAGEALLTAFPEEHPADDIETDIFA